MSNAPPTTSLTHSYGAGPSSPSQQRQQLQQLQPASTSSGPAPASSANGDPTFESLQQAGKTIDDKLQKDEQWVTVGDRLGSE